MICTILGGAGFVGSHLTEELLAAGCKVRIFDRPDCDIDNIKHVLDDVEFYPGDFQNEKDYIASLKGTDVVFHLISSTLPENSNWDPAYDVKSNVVGSLKLLDECVRYKVRKVVFISSGGVVYGVPKTTPIREDHSMNPISSYGISKMVIEKYLHLYHHLYGLDYTVLRVSNAYGERQNLKNAQGVISLWLHRALLGKELEIWGDGSVVRDYIYIKDVVRAFLMAARTQTSEKVFNVGAGKGYSLNQLIEIIQTQLLISLKVTFKAGRKCDVPVNVLDTSLVENILKWKATTDIIQGLENTFRWLKEQKSKEYQSSYPLVTA